MVFLNIPMDAETPSLRLLRPQVHRTALPLLLLRILDPGPCAVPNSHLRLFPPFP